MKLVGHLYEVTELASFIQHYVVNKSRPCSDSIRPIRDARIALYQWNQIGSRCRALVESRTDETGRFELHASVLPDTSVFLVAYGHDSTTEATVELEQGSGCWYRSLPFVPDAIDELHRDLYVARLVLPSESGFSQATLAAVLSETKQQVADLEWIKGTITPGGIVLSCGGKGARASGRLVLNPDLSGDLSRIVRHSIEDFQLDLPGPSWLVGLVVSRDAIEGSIRAGLADLAIEISKRLRLSAIGLFTDQVQTTDPELSARLAAMATLTLERLRYPVVAHQGGANSGHRAIAGDVCLGFSQILQREEPR
jgi:hypothetical protein